MRSTLPPLLAAPGVRLWSPSSSGVRRRPPGRRGATITLGAVAPNTSFSPTPNFIMGSSSECRIRGTWPPGEEDALPPTADPQALPPRSLLANARHRALVEGR